ncbi:unnamed protein product [Cochlearia groenlandica]
MGVFPSPIVYWVPPASLKKLASSPIPISFLVGIPFVEYQRVGPLSGMQSRSRLYLLGQASSGIPVPVLVEYLFIPSASSYLRRIIPCLSPGRASAFYSYSLSAARP